MDDSERLFNETVERLGWIDTGQLVAVTRILYQQADITYDQMFLLVTGWYQELFERRCDNCNMVLEVHVDAKWRFSEHVIRCRECASEMIDKGLGWDEAFYVE